MVVEFVFIGGTETMKGKELEKSEEGCRVEVWHGETILMSEAYEKQNIQSKH